MRFLTSHDFEPLLDRLLTQFNAPFDVVNAAVFEILSVRAARQLAEQAIETTAGAVRYSIRWPNDDAAWIFVQKRAESLTSITIHPCVRRDARQAWQIETIHMASELMAYIGQEVHQTMRHYIHPEFTLRPVPGLTPPCPSWNDNPLGALAWKVTYAQDMRDQDFAEQLGISVQRLYNARSEYGIPQRTQRGKAQRKVGKKR